MVKRVLIAGLDSAPADLVLREFREELPVLSGLMARGLSGEMTSCHPPITIPAWLVMASSRSPGSLGLYGFRHRRGHSYHNGWIANSQAIPGGTLWDILGKAGRQVCLVGVPPSYPPYPVNGHLISCFITPDSTKPYCYPSTLKGEIEGLVGEYIFDAEFRTDDRDKLLERLYEMTRRRFQVIEYLLTKKSWDLAQFVEIGVDRVQHAFWKYFDPQHHLYQPGHPYARVILDYYRFLDQKLGEVLSHLDSDTAVLVVSDHGAKGMKGAFCVNQWLMEEGYLVLKEPPTGVSTLEKVEVDWARTRAWGWGGYYARIFLNVQGREAQGVIPPQDYEAEREKLREKLLAVRDPQGRPMANKVHRPEELYDQCQGDIPDLMVYFDDLSWRSAGTVGHPGCYLEENDTGPDDAVHDYKGIFILSHPELREGRRLPTLDILDVAPTVLGLLGIPQPPQMRGKAIPLEEI